MTEQVVLYPKHELSAWLRDRIGAICSLLISETRYCEHLADPINGAETAHIWLHELDLWVCFQCLSMIEPGPDERFRCDRCGGWFEDQIRPFVAMPEPWLAVAFGLCPDCSRREVCR